LGVATGEVVPASAGYISFLFSSAKFWPGNAVPPYHTCAEYDLSSNRFTFFSDSPSENVVAFIKTVL
jgi:hypothetical protein